MKHCLALICVLASLCGGVFTMYSAVSVGSDGLDLMSSSLLSLGKVMRAYYANLNAARNQVWPAITNLQLYANTTYTALNVTYGATQPGMSSMMSSIQWFTQQFTYGDQMVRSTISNDLSQLNSLLQQTVDQILQNYNTLANSISYNQNGDFCSEQYAGMTSSIPVQLAKFGRCLQTEVDTVPTLVTPLLAIFTLALNDLKSLNQQLQICSPTSLNCINAYFMDIYSEVSNVNMELYLAQNLLMTYQQDAMSRNQLCGQLITANVQDIVQNLSMMFNQCMYPSTMMG